MFVGIFTERFICSHWGYKNKGKDRKKTKNNRVRASAILNNLIRRRLHVYLTGNVKCSAGWVTRWPIRSGPEEKRLWHSFTMDPTAVRGGVWIGDKAELLMNIRV